MTTGSQASEAGGARALGGVGRLALAGPAADRFLDGALSLLRWTILALALLITLIWPGPGRTGHPLWLFVAAFIGYNAIVELLRRATSRLRSFAWVPLTDLPVAGTLYYLDREPGGPLFISFYLAVVTAAATLPFRRTALYTAAAVAVVAAIAPTLPEWAATPEDLRQLSARLVVLSLVGIGMTLLTRRLVAAREVAGVMRAEADRLAELDRLRASFISTVSHDLRSPLASARLALGVLQATATERHRPQERDLLATARRNLDRLTFYVDDLLAVNQLDAGMLQVRREPLDLRAVVADAVAALHPLFADKGQLLEVELPEALPVVGDARRLEQVLLNLLSNAHSHTPAGARTVVAGRLAGAEVRLAVADNGPGIPAGELGRIFERFYRLDTTTRGSGLGLVVARSIVELHGGRLWAESRPGAGATFHLALPRRPRDPAPAPEGGGRAP